MAERTKITVTSTLKPEEVAERLGVETSTLKDWRKKGIGPPYINLTTSRGHVRYDVDLLNEWMRQHTVQEMTPTPEELEEREKFPEDISFRVPAGTKMIAIGLSRSRDTKIKDVWREAFLRGLALMREEEKSARRAKQNKMFARRRLRGGKWVRTPDSAARLSKRGIRGTGSEYLRWK